MSSVESYKNHKQSGFTIIELLVATVVFSVILLLSTSILIQISRMYYKGLVTTRTQNAARTVIDDISRSIQFSGEMPSYPSSNNQSITPHYFCIGKTRYTYFKNMQRASANDLPNQKILHVLWKDEVVSPSNCGTALPNLQNPIPSTGGKELLEKGMRIGNQGDPSASIIKSSNGVYQINLLVFYGDNGVINFDTSTGDPLSCKGALTGAQFCAFSNLSTEVYNRVQ